MKEKKVEKVPWDSKVVQIVLLCTLLAPLGVPLISPGLPAIKDNFGISDSRASLLISSYFIVGIILSPFIGVIVDRFGRKIVLVLSLVVFSLTGSSMYFIPDFTLILILRFIQGTAAAGLFITTVTLIGDTFDGIQRTAVFGINAAALSIGAALFPIVGGILVSISWNTPFLAYLLGIPLALFTLKVLEEPIKENKRFQKGYIRKTLKLIRKREMILPYTSSILTEVLLFGAVFTLLPFILLGKFGLSPVYIGAIISIASITTALVSTQSGRLANRFSDHQMIALGIFFYGLAMLGISSLSTVFIIVMSVIMFGAGIGVSMPAVDSAISDFVPLQQRGGALSIRNSTTFLGRASGSFIFASLAAIFGYTNLFLIVGGIVLTFAILLSIKCTFQIKNSRVCLRRST